VGGGRGADMEMTTTDIYVGQLPNLALDNEIISESSPFIGHGSKKK
jgi:hypothetical protein